jgi:membrane protease YdiL (CAAX protease family)
MGNSIPVFVAVAAFLGVWILAASSWSIPHWLKGKLAMPARESTDVSWSAVWGVAAWWLSMFCVNAGFGLVSRGREFDAVSFVQLNALIQVMQALLLFGMLRFSFPSHSPPPASDWGWPGDGILRDTAWGLRLFALILPIVLLVNVVVMMLQLRAEGTEGQHEFIGMVNESGPDPRLLIWMGLAVIVAAPFVEEFQYRVVLQSSIEKGLGTPTAVWCTAVVFAAAHFKPSRAGNPDWIPLIPLAIAFGYLYVRRRSYLACVILHAAFNAFNFALLQFTRPGG